MKRKYIYSLAGVILMGMVALIPVGIVSAQAVTQDGSTFIQKLAARLGLSEEVVQEAVAATHDELRSEMEINREESVANAVSEGKLTQRQADLLTAIADVRPELKGVMFDIRSEDFNDLTRGERQAQHEEMRSELDQKLVDALNANGLNTTLEEVQEAMKAEREAGIGFEMGKMHKFGFGSMM